MCSEGPSIEVGPVESQLYCVMPMVSARWIVGVGADVSGVQPACIWLGDSPSRIALDLQVED